MSDEIEERYKSVFIMAFSEMVKFFCHLGTVFRKCQLVWFTMYTWGIEYDTLLVMLKAYVYCTSFTKYYSTIIFDLKYVLQ